MAFRVIGAKKKSIQVAEQILDAIRQGHYKPGDKLPPEADIAKATGVSRTAVREALSALRLAQVVKSIPGDGTYVTRADIGPEALIRLEEEEAGVLDVLEARRVLESAIMEFVIDKTDPSRLDEVEKIVKEMEDAVSGKDYARYLDLNEAFHTMIADAACNPLISQLIRSLLTSTKSQLWREAITEYFLRDNFQRSLQEHRMILDALRRGDRQAVKALIKRHFATVEEAFK